MIDWHHENLLQMKLLRAVEVYFGRNKKLQSTQSREGEKRFLGNFPPGARYSLSLSLTKVLLWDEDALHSRLGIIICKISL